MNFIDYYLPTSAGFPVYFLDVWIRLVELDKKSGWIETNVGESYSPNMVPDFDIRPEANYRTVAGYCAFGKAGNIRDLTNKEWPAFASNSVILWGPTYFLNWKDTYIEPPKLYNAIRIWSRGANRFYVYADTYKLVNELSGSMLTLPGQGSRVYPPVP
jgi:hypothetical protein